MPSRVIENKHRHLILTIEVAIPHPRHHGLAIRKIDRLINDQIIPMIESTLRGNCMEFVSSIQECTSKKRVQWCDAHDRVMKRFAGEDSDSERRHDELRTLIVKTLVQ